MLNRFQVFDIFNKFYLDFLINISHIFILIYRYGCYKMVNIIIS